MSGPVERLPWTLRQGYGLAALSLAVANTAVMFFLLKFLVDVAGLSPATAGAAILVGELWDAISDPLIGRWSDRTRTAWGRRRPWILGGAAPFTLAFVALFWGIPMVGPAEVVAYTLLLIAYNTFYTFVVVPYGALTPELTPDYDERTRLNGARMAWSMVGGIVSGVGVPLLVNRAPDALAQAGVLLPAWLAAQPYRLAALAVAPLAFLPLLLTVAATRGRDRPPAEVEAHQPMWSVLRVGPFRRTVVLFICAWSTTSVLAALIPFYVQHHLEHPKLLDAVFGAIQVSALLFVPIVVKLAERLEKHRAYALAIGSWALVMLGLALLPAGTGWPALVVAGLAGLGVAAAHVLPWSMLPDVIEVDRVDTGQERAGAFYGVMTFLEKLATGVSLWVLGVGLELAGYVEGAAAQPDSAKLALRVLIGPMPAVVLLCAVALALLRPPLTRAMHAALRARLSGGEG